MKLLSVRCEQGEGIRLVFRKFGWAVQARNVRRRREILNAGAIFWLVAVGCMMGGSSNLIISNQGTL